MTWAFVIQLILELFGPALSELIREWLENLLNRSAPFVHSPNAADGLLPSDVRHLFAEAEGRLSRIDRWRGRGVVLRRLRALVLARQPDIAAAAVRGGWHGAVPSLSGYERGVIDGAGAGRPA